MNTILNQPRDDGRCRRRLHSDEFKANAVASCMQPGTSMAAVAMANGVNSSFLRRWVREAELGHSAVRPDALVPTGSALCATTPSFAPMQLLAKNAVRDIRIALGRGATAITVTWPTDAAAQCAAWMRELLR